MSELPPTLTLISDHLDRQAELRPSQGFLVHEGTRLTYAATKEAVDLLARALIAGGIERGDRVAMMGNPRPEFFIHFLAVTSIGAIWVGLNPKYTSGELDHVVSDAEPRMLFGFSESLGDPNMAILQRLVEAHASIEQLVVFDKSSPSSGTGWDTFLSPANTVSDADLAGRRAVIDPLDAAYLVYTSGSTGRPKGAVLTHRGTNVCNVIAVERKALSDRSIICNFPINHVAAIGDVCGRTMTGGGTIYFQETFSPAAVLSLIEAERLNTIAGVPTMLQMCVNHPDFAGADLTSVDLIAWGGAGMPADLLATLMEKTDCHRCTMGYGMTEVTGGVTYSGLADSIELLTTTVGTPDKRQDIRIWHSDDRLASSGEPGEIQVRGDFTTIGYWRSPDATAASLTDDGWFKTGDLAVHRKDGYVQIVGRMSEMFKSGGYNVYPREVEMALEQHPGVGVAAVISIPDATFQEVGIAYVLPSSDAGEVGLDVSELRTLAQGLLANYKVPKEIHVLDELPMLPIGKVDKKTLKTAHLESK